MSVRDGRFQVAAEVARHGGRKRLPRLALGAEMLATLLSGALSPVRAAETGLVTSTGGGAETVEPWFRARPAFLYPLNAF